MYYSFASRSSSPNIKNGFGIGFRKFEFLTTFQNLFIIIKYYFLLVFKQPNSKRQATCLSLYGSLDIKFNDSYFNILFK